jgi:hypothetical protein
LTSRLRGCCEVEVGKLDVVAVLAAQLGMDDGAASPVP